LRISDAKIRIIRMSTVVEVEILKGVLCAKSYYEMTVQVEILENVLDVKS